jgi:hypothetical protein
MGVCQEEYTALIKYIQMGKENDTDWFQIESNKEVRLEESLHILCLYGPCSMHSWDRGAQKKNAGLPKGILSY